MSTFIINSVRCCTDIWARTKSGYIVSATVVVEITTTLLFLWFNDFLGIKKIFPSTEWHIFWSATPSIKKVVSFYEKIKFLQTFILLWNFNNLIHFFFLMILWSIIFLLVFTHGILRAIWKYYFCCMVRKRNDKG